LLSTRLEFIISLLDVYVRELCLYMRIYTI